MVGLVGSLAISLAAWILFDTLLVFLLVPLVPLLFRGLTTEDHRSIKRCPDCGFETNEPTYTHCPRDGTELQ